jgi:hypothetical protein
MSADYGKQMAQAMMAIRGMHSDCVRLFRDLDRTLSSYESLYGNVVTLNLGSSISRQVYLAEGLIRLYVPKGKEQQMLGINICFFDENDNTLVEPLFVAANVRYISATSDPQEKTRKGWDPWSAFLAWSPERVYGQPILIENPPKRPSIERVIVAAAPLYSVVALEDALAIVDLVGRP